MNISIEQFAQEAGVSQTIISKRIRSGEIEAIAVVEGNQLVFRIDTAKYDPKDHSARKGGRPVKSKI